MYAVEFEALTTIVINAAIFWDIAPCGPYVNRRSSETSFIHGLHGASASNWIACRRKWSWHGLKYYSNVHVG
jgi:hypothetical protein